MSQIKQVTYVQWDKERGTICHTDGYKFPNLPVLYIWDGEKRYYE